MAFNFKPVTPSKGSSLFSEAIRLTSTNLSFGEDVLPGVSGKERVAVNVDVSNGAIQLKKDHTGYKVQVNDAGGSRYITCAKRLVKAGMLIGDYVPVPGENGVWVLATRNTHEE